MRVDPTKISDTLRNIHISYCFAVVCVYKMNVPEICSQIRCLSKWCLEHLGDNNRRKYIWANNRDSVNTNMTLLFFGLVRFFYHDQARNLTRHLKKHFYALTSWREDLLHFVVVCEHRDSSSETLYTAFPPKHWQYYIQLFTKSYYLKSFVT